DDHFAVNEAVDQLIAGAQVEQLTHFLGERHLPLCRQRYIPLHRKPLVIRISSENIQIDGRFQIFPPHRASSFSPSRINLALSALPPPFLSAAATALAAWSRE